MDPGTLLAGALVGALLAVGSLFLAVRPRRAQGGAPAAVPPAPPAQPELPVTREQLAEALGELASVRAEWMAWKKQVEAFLEEFDELAETIERRRTRIAASVSKRERHEREQAEQQAHAGGNGTRDALVAAARARGFPV